MTDHHATARSGAVILCVLLWPRSGMADAVAAYEDRVLDLVADHEGRVRSRVRRVSDEDDQPFEVQVLEFRDRTALQAYMEDPRRVDLSADRERAIARTEVIDVELVVGGERGIPR